MLQLTGITKSFSTRRALNEVSFRVEAGKLTGFVGANGAGKTTTMRIILGVLAADSGTVTLDGETVTTAQRHRFGYMPEERGLYPKMKVAEQLVYLARLHGLSKQDAGANTERLLERLGLTERANEAVEKLSLGNQQRAQIAAALVHDPAVLVLDEPFSGLDPLAVETVLAILKEHADRGVPVLFSSHQLDVVERLCDELVIIADGQVRAAGSRSELLKAHAGSQYQITVDGGTGWVAGQPDVSVVESTDDRITFAAEPDAAERVLRAAVERGAVHAFTPLQPSLAEIFKEVVQ